VDAKAASETRRPGKGVIQLSGNATYGVEQVALRDSRIRELFSEAVERRRKSRVRMT